MTELDRGLMMLRLHLDGSAVRVGVMAGDILVRVGEVVAGKPEEINRRLGSESVGWQLPLQVIRGRGAAEPQRNDRGSPGS